MTGEATTRNNLIVTTCTRDELPTEQVTEFAGQVKLVRHSQIETMHPESCTGTLWIHVSPEKLYNDGITTTTTLRHICSRFPHAQDVRVVHTIEFSYGIQQLPVIGFGNERADLAALEYDWEVLEADDHTSCPTFVIGPYPIIGRAEQFLVDLYTNGVIGPVAIALPACRTPENQAIYAAWVVAFEHHGFIGVDYVV
jgi:hypothetical protein